MEENGCISVIIPLYNNRHTIERAVCSALSQSYTKIEVLVVDDGSEDNGLALVESMDDPRVRCYRLPHRNADVARNYGITHCHGTYIAMLDADDEWKENHLASSLDVLRKKKADGVYGSLILRGETDQEVVTRALQKDESMIDFLLTNGCAVQTSTLLMTAISARDILWDETLSRHQDYDFVVRYCRKYRLCPKREATTIYHVSQRPKTIDFDSCIRFIHRVEHEISDHVYMDYHLQMLYQAIACSADDSVIAYYRKAATYYEYLLSLRDYLSIRNPKNKVEALGMKIRYLWNLLRVPVLV